MCMSSVLYTVFLQYTKENVIEKTMEEKIHFTVLYCSIYLKKSTCTCTIETPAVQGAGVRAVLLLRSRTACQGSGKEHLTGVPAGSDTFTEMSELS